MTRTIAALAVSLAALLVTSAHAAEGNLRLGPVRVHPWLEVKETYESNLFLLTDEAKDAVDEPSDWTTEVTPGLQLALPMQRFLLQLKGDATFSYHAEHDEEDATTYTLGGSLGADFPGGLDFEIGDDYTREYRVSNAEFGPGEYTDENAFRARVGFAIRDAFRVQLGYTGNLFAYELSTDRDRSEHIVQGQVHWRFQPRTSAFLEVDYGVFAYDTNTMQDNTELGASLGLAWDITSRSTGELKLGYEVKDYEETSLADGRELEDGQYATATARVRHSFTQRTAGDLDLSIGSEESDFQDNPYYVQTRVGAGLTQRFTSKIYGRVGAAYTRDDYPNEILASNPYHGEWGDRTDTMLEGEVSLGFDVLRWLGIQLRYAGEARSSTFDQFEYTNHTVGLSLKASL